MACGRLILGAALGSCVHVAGIIHFLSIAEDEGYKTKFLGPAVSVDALFDAIYKEKPDIVSISYRLTPSTVTPLLNEINIRRRELPFPVDWEFGGTKPVSDIARTYGFFSFISDGFDDINDSLRYLRKISRTSEGYENYGSSLIDRIRINCPYPILRHHFGRPSLEETVKGIERIADAKVLDVISIGPDQNAQQFFFKPELMEEAFTGAGGVPVRSPDDFKRLKAASVRGNYPLMRCYSGTEDVFKYAAMLMDTLQNAWAAIPLSWYNELDGRGTRSLETSMAEAQRLIKWHAERGIPVEINEPHHWGLRDAHDVISVAMAYISAYNAKKLGVRHYIAQYMFNTPNGLSFSMDLAKVLAMIEMAERLQDETFTVYRETRAGLALFHADKDIAKGQLAASTFMQMAVKPHILHVVGYCEADHAASAEEVIESCRIAKGVVRHVLRDTFSMERDAAIIERKDELIREAEVLLSFIEREYSSCGDPLCSVECLCDCIKKGYIDAVHIVKSGSYVGDLKTRIIDGKCLAVNTVSNEPICEETRLIKRKALLAKRSKTA